MVAIVIVEGMSVVVNVMLSLMSVMSLPYTSYRHARWSSYVLWVCLH